MSILWNFVVVQHSMRSESFLWQLQTIVLTSGLVEHDLPGAPVRHLLVGRTAGQGLGLVRVALVHTVSGVDLHNK